MQLFLVDPAVLLAQLALVVFAVLAAFLVPVALVAPAAPVVLLVFVASRVTNNLAVSFVGVFLDRFVLVVVVVLIGFYMLVVQSNNFYSGTPGQKINSQSGAQSTSGSISSGVQDISANMDDISKTLGIS